MADETLTAASSSIPTPSIAPTAAPGLKGPSGISPRQNYSRVNTGVLSGTDAGALEQKSIMPKVGSAMSISMATRPRALNDMLKTAMESAMGRSKVAEEAKKQLQNLEHGDGDDDKDDKKKKEKDSCMKTSSADVLPTDYVLKLAAASDYISELLKEGADLAGPYTLTENTQGPGAGPNTLPMTYTTPTGPGQVIHTNSGQAGTNKPGTPGMQKAMPQERGATQLENDKDRAPGAGDPPVNGSTKNASAPIELLRKMAAGMDPAMLGAGADGPPPGAPPPGAGAEGPPPELAMLASLPPEALAALIHLAEEQGILPGAGGGGAPPGAPPGIPGTPAAPPGAAMEEGPKIAAPIALLRKMAEDAINPAQISAGSAESTRMPVSVTGEAGPPADGKGRVPSDYAGVAGLSRRDAKSVPKGEMHKLLDEPMMSSAHDNVLQQVFSHTNEAGAKISSAGNVKLAAAKALLRNLADGGK